jgi:competence protein ComEA
MTDPVFDWHALEGSAPTVQPAAQAIRPSRAALLGAVTVLGLVTAAAGAYLAWTAPDATLLIDGGAAGFMPAGSSPAGSAPVAAGTIVVDVEGAVVRPGLVMLPPGSRVGDAIDAAGGFGALVDARSAGAVNLAALATDGMQILVPARGASGAPASPGVPPGSAVSTGTLDLNRATEAELEALPGIGPATAAKILAARSEARFTSVNDLQSRKLVGPATFQKIRDLVSVGG